MERIYVPGVLWDEFTTKFAAAAQAMTLSATTLRGVEIYLAVGCLYFAIYRAGLTLLEAVERRYRVPGIGPG